VHDAMVIPQSSWTKMHTKLWMHHCLGQRKARSCLNPNQWTHYYTSPNLSVSSIISGKYTKKASIVTKIFPPQNIRPLNRWHLNAQHFIGYSSTGGELRLHDESLSYQVQSFIHSKDSSHEKAKELIEMCSLLYDKSPTINLITQAQAIFHHSTQHLISSIDSSLETSRSISIQLNHILAMLIKSGDIQNTIEYFNKNIRLCNSSSFHMILNICASNQLSQEAEDILLEMTKSASQCCDPDDLVSPNTTTFNLVLKAQRLPQRAQSILERMISLWKIDGHENIKPDIISFNTVMNSYVQWKDNVQSSEGSKKQTKRSANVEVIFNMLEKEMEGTDIIPDVKSYNILLHALVLDNNPHFAETLLREMIELDTLPDPDTISYATCISGYARNRNIEKAVELLHDSTLSRNGELYPATFGYNSLIRGMCNLKQPERAEKIFDEMQGNRDLGTYNILIDAFSIQRKPSRAHRILDQLEKEFLPRKDTNEERKMLRPNSFSYNSIISAYSSAGQAERAASILRRMEMQYQNWNHDVLPDTITYNIVLSAYLKNQAKISYKAAIQANDLLMRMEKSYQEGKKEVQPDIITYTTVMKCWILSKHQDTYNKITSILNKIEDLEDNDDDSDEKRIQLDSAVYNVYLNVFSDPKILEKIRCSQDITALTFQILDRMLSRSEKKNNPKVKPNIITYNTVLNILVKHGQVERAYDMLLEMENGAAHSDDLYPSTLSYNTVLNGFAISNKPQKAKDLLEKMNQLTNQNSNEKDIDHKGRPNIHSFNTVITAYAKVGDAENADQVLHMIKDLHYDQSSFHLNKRVKPDQKTYAAVMSAYAKSGDKKSYERIQDLLQEMSNDWGLKPDTTCHNIIIHSLARGHQERKARKAYEIFQQMEEPNLTSLNSLLNTCAFTKQDTEKKEALQIVLSIMKEIIGKNERKESTILFKFKNRPDEITYSTFIKACHNLMNGRPYRDKVKLLEGIFVDACQNGYVGNLVLKEMRYALYEDQVPRFLNKIQQHMSSHSKSDKANKDNVRTLGSINALPRRWSYNIRM